MRSTRTEKHQKRKPLKAAIALLAVLAVVALVAVLVVGLSGWRAWSNGPEDARWSAWLAEWHWQAGIDDFRIAAAGLDSLQLFAVYFDERDELHVTERWDEALPEVRRAVAESGVQAFDLSIVNDIKLADGTDVQKDAELVGRLVATGESRRKHVDAIVALAEEYGFTGVEIDYEAIRSEDWDNLRLFYGALYEALALRGKSLRVVLEQRAPLESLDWPEGPMYVVMAYNLHGYHSGPGPKADYAMIRDIAQRLSHVPQGAIAFAAGGFAWSDDGAVTALTEKQAQQLELRAALPVQRDEASGSLYFDYEDEQGRAVTVWYADGETLRGWRDESLKLGVADMALWRLGELSEPSAALPLELIRWE